MAQKYDADGFLIADPAETKPATTASPTVDADGYLIAPPATTTPTITVHGTRPPPDWGSSVFGSIVGAPRPGSWGAQVDKDVRDWLAPKPGQQYGDIVPFKIDPKTGGFDWTAPTLPNVLRNALTQAATPISEGTTVDPTTGRYGMTPEMLSAAQMFLPATALGFSHPFADITVADREALAARTAAARAAPGPTAEAAAIDAAGGSYRPATAADAGLPGHRVNPTTGLDEMHEPAPPPRAAAPGQPSPAPLPPVSTPGQLQRAIDETAADRAGPNMVDDNVYVPGVQRPLAAREFSPQNSLDHKTAIAKDQDYRAQQEKLDRANDTTIKKMLQDDALGPDEMDAARTARRQVAPDKFGAFAGEVQVDAAPLVKAVDDALNSTKTPEVIGVLNTVKKALYDNAGNLETLPSRLYQARKVITDTLDKVNPRPATPGAEAANASQAFLSKLLPDFDNIISDGATKYGDYMKAWADASKPIDQMSFLQKYLPGGSKNIYDTSGHTTTLKLNGVLKDIFQGKKAAGVNEAQSLTDAQIQNILAARNEAAALEFRDNQARTRGSDTFQQIKADAQPGPVPSIAKGLAQVGANMGAQGLAYLHGGGFGAENALLTGAQSAYYGTIAPALRARAAQAVADRVEADIAARKQELLQTAPGTRSTRRGPQPPSRAGAALNIPLSTSQLPEQPNPLTPPP